MSFTFDSLKYSYPSRRRVVFGKRGMVCTTQPLAAQAGLDILKKGGNAIDAAIATAACLTVIEPNNSGIGGDAFAIVWVKDRLYGLNGSGPAPMGIDLETVRERCGDTVPKYGWTPVTVPGAPSTWAELSARFGKLPFRELLRPAIDYAEEGFPVAPVTAKLWSKYHKMFREAFHEDYLEHWFETFTPEDRGPRPGEIVRLPNHAETLRELAETNCESLYRGALAERIDAFSRETGGYLRKEDLAAYRAEWVDPISIDYRGYTVSEMPPNGNGIVALMALKTLSQFEFTNRDCADTYHKQLEAMKMAFADGQEYVADPASMRVTVERMLSDEYAAKRAARIGETALEPQYGDPSCGGTVYLCAADGEGNMISFIESNYIGFGSGVVVPGTGVAFQNRGNNFSLDPKSANCLAPGKKSYHTIIPGFLSKDGKPVGPFGVMGGFMQPQGHVQVVMNTVDFHMNPQEALDAPRWQWTGGMEVQVERDFPAAEAERLMRMGHQITVPPENYFFGRGQIIWRDDDGVLCGATEPRSDGTVAVW